MKKKGTVLIALFLFFFFICNAFAQDLNNNLNILFSKIENVYKAINILKVDYTQNIIFESTNEKQKVSGTLFFYKPNNVYISQKTPKEQKIYIDDKEVAIYNLENSQVIIDSWQNVFDGDFSVATIINFGNNLNKMKKTNTISVSGENEKYIILKVVPIKRRDLVLEIYISKTSMYPGKSILQSVGTKAETIFESYVVNPILDKKNFKLNVSNEVEIIRLN
ncbi:MAG: outer membrane lipoprotein carrier protein LolA [Endomicrobium sp.]|jgi:outer membrane lipoprotein-sorting protein|nr:outer membrane lipoprotein carrier protein LolA [Endomicrobium sp.]